MAEFEPPAGVEALFTPRSISIVGASDSSSHKAAILKNVENIGYTGRVYPVNPRRETVAGKRCYPSLEALPETPDAVILALGAAAIPDAVEQAAQIGARACIVFTGGFAEIDGEGALRQQEMSRIAASHGMALLGPNCQGSISFVDRSALYLHSVEAGYGAGGLAVISQSGSLTDAIVNNGRGVAWGHVVSTGNEGGVTAADVLAHLTELDACRGVCMFLETIRDPVRLFEAFDRANDLGKPVIVLKVGRSAEAQEAATAHTGALGSPSRLTDAALLAHGAVSVNSIDELLTAAAFVQAGALPRGNRVGLVVGSGGLKAMAFDAAGEVEFPDLAPTTMDGLDRCTGPWVDVGNPLDYWPTDDFDRNYPEMLGCMASDPNVDVVLEFVQYLVRPTSFSGMPEYATGALTVGPEHAKPFVVCSPVAGELPPPDEVRRAADRGVVLVSGIDHTLRAIGSLAKRNRLDPISGEAEPISPETIDLRGRTSAGAEALDVMRSAGIDVVETLSAVDLETALQQAQRIGYPVTVKLGDPEVLHKTEIGGVEVGLPDEDSLRAAAARLLQSGSPLLLQPTVQPPFAELIIGVTTDPVLGRFVVVGMGGIRTEVLDDAIAWPVGSMTEFVATWMLSQLTGYPTLVGSRGKPRLAVESAARTIVCLDSLVAANPEIGVVDLNPLMVTADRAFAVDALIGPSSVGGAPAIPTATAPNA